MITYIATNTINGKFYIGSTNNLKRRKRSHLTSLLDYPFQRSLRKNPEAFEWETWEDDSNEPALEQALLDMWFGKEQCYNLSPLSSRPPGNLGVPHSDKTKQKISVAMTGKNIGETNGSKSKEAREKIAAKKRGIPRPQEVRDKLSQSCTGKFHWVNALGERKLQKECPGDGWQRGMKWRQ